MSTEPEWGPWVDGCEESPIGAYIQVVITDDDEIMPDLIHEGVYICLCPDGGLIMSPPFKELGNWTVDMWRQRKPRGMVILQELIENLPAPSKERENA